MDLGKQQELDAVPKATEQINFTEIWIEQEIQQCCSFLKK